ncbi:hypothetical protein SteCoe_19350 [Stentor coeruleus]|uniref:PLD phosphodiesterase domain-containing protein n=1 Tax=Stentor coeruleus TaxID=5963 RepID=A0A1R2BUR3_9CILI|nr:hypothetical protein SteCoe_19350 [Stentor coeruleus]
MESQQKIPDTDTPEEIKKSTTTQNEENLKKRKRDENEKEEERKNPIFTTGTSIFITPLNFIYPKPENILTIRQILYEDLKDIPNRPKTLQGALLTTFALEMEFIMPIVTAGFKVCIVSHGKPERVEKISDNFTVVYPKVQQWGSFHPKLFILKFPYRLRIVITSANLVGCDWNLIGQCIWFQDFFYGDDPDAGFLKDLKKFVDDIIPKKTEILKELGIDLDRYNFRNSAVDLITSVPGKYRIPCDYGFEKINQFVKKKYSHFTYQCSSVGALTGTLKKDICKSFTNNPNCEIDIIFPCFRNVMESHLGTPGAGVFFMKENSYKNEDFLHKNLCSMEGPTESFSGHLSHSKVLIIHDNYEINDETLIYIGSHNLSGAAWGKYEKNNTQLSISNYEAGIIFKSQPDSKDLKKYIISQLPFKFPPSKYLRDDRPFFIDTDMGK